MRLLALLLVSGCCSDRQAPVLEPPDGAWTGVGEVYEVPLTELVLSSRSDLADLEFEVTGGEHLDVGISGDSLYAIPDPGWSGREPVTLTVIDRCATSELEFELGVGALAGDCDTTFSYSPQGNPSSVQVAGDFSDWEPVDMTQAEDGTWGASMALAPGAYAYKYIENGVDWLCDPEAQAMQCDEGYDSSTWQQCSPGTSSCNSVVLVGECAQPAVEVASLSVDRAGGSLDVTLRYVAGSTGAAVGSVSLTVDGSPDEGASGWTGDAPLALTLTGLEAGRHTVRLELSDTEGHAAEPLYIPVWTDGRDWDGGLLYYAFVDRFHNGDTGNDEAFGSSHDFTDYQGGDWQGVIDKLDYLDDLGVTAIWLTAPQNNGDGVWGTKCNATFTGYHGYWPSDAWNPEEHFGDEAKLRELIAGAHGRGMRVLVDWVGNHVHTQHPYYSEHPEWFNEQRLCNDANNWNDIPETCWFDAFIPDVDYYQVEPSQVMVDDAVSFAKEYGIDGYRVDAVKHMPHTVYFNMQSRIRAEIEHREAGGDEDFYTVGETFDGDRGLIGSYINDRELDAQFDFPLYFTLRAALIDHTASLADLESSLADSQAAFAGRTMSAFLGNHDVARFSTVADRGDLGSCATADSIHEPAPAPDWDVPYEKLKLGWTFLLAGEGLPLVYYGDEIGLPGHNDPDNRQLMRFPGELSDREAGVLDHVQRLGRARRDHPQLGRGTRTNWWLEDDVLAWARELDGAGMVAVINRSDSERTLSNGLSFAGLPTGGSWRNVLTDEVVSAAGDNLTITVPARGSAVLVTLDP